MLNHEPMEWKSDGDVNGERAITELLRAPPADTSGRGLSHANWQSATSNRLAGKVHPNRHTKGEMGLEGIELTLRHRWIA